MKTVNSQPFAFGEVVSQNIFLNRTNDIEKLHQNFKNSINTILISPRRWGKTSLVKKASETFINADYRFVFMDCFRVSTKQQFLEEFASRVIEATATQTEERLKSIGDLFKRLVPELGLSADLNNELNLKLKWTSDTLPESEILNLPQSLAEQKNIRIIVCIDEFQNIAHFDSKEKFQKVLRSYWQHHTNVTYCLYGSKRHLMVDFFNKSSMPFYKFGEILFLPKIEESEWVQYIIKRFQLFDKTISAEFAKRITEAVQCHSYYVQQLAYLVYTNTEEEVTEPIYRFSIENLLNQNQLLYQRIMDDLSANQIEYLRAMVDGVTSFYSKKVAKNYNLGTIGNLKRIKDALENKEVIDTFSKVPTFVDPVFELWFKTYYLNRPLFAN